MDGNLHASVVLIQLLPCTDIGKVCTISFFLSVKCGNLLEYCLTPHGYLMLSVDIGTLRIEIYHFIMCGPRVALVRAHIVFAHFLKNGHQGRWVR